MPQPRLHCIALHCIALHCIALHCSTLPNIHCTATVQYNALALQPAILRGSGWWYMWYHSFNCAFVQKQKCILGSKKAKRFHQTTKKRLMLENVRILLPGSRTWRITSYGNSTLKILHSQVAKEYMQLISRAPQPPLGNTIFHAQHALHKVKS